MPQSQPKRTAQSAPAEVLTQLALGYNGYTDPTLTNPKMWAASSNCFSGPFGYIQRARFASITNVGAAPVTSLKYFALPGLSSYMLSDVTTAAGNGLQFSLDAGSTYTGTPRTSPYLPPLTPLLTGPWSREALQNIIYEMNGQVKQTGRLANAATIEGWGLDAPDTSPQVVISAGASQAITNIQRTNGVVTATIGGALTVPGGNGIGVINVTIATGDSSFAGSFTVQTGSGGTTLTWNQVGQNTALLTPTGTVNTNITKSQGRSYSYAWENANKAHIGAPSPSTQFIAYSAQNGAIQLTEVGTVSCAGATTAVTGTGTLFTSAWIGRSLWVVGAGNVGRIVAVPSATSLTLAANGPVIASQSFQVFDPQSTHLDLYATADGGATYFLVARNAWVPASTTLTGSGLQFFDNANAEPPGFPFTTTISQLYNVPPPIGSFVNEYQGRLIVYGVAGANQTFFYSGLELVSQGQPQESFPPLNQVTLPIQNATINGMVEFPGAMVLWSNRQDMFRITGQLTDNTSATAPQIGSTISRLPYNLGCASPFATAITPLGAFWLTPQAEVWVFTDSYAPRNVGRPIQDILNSVPLAQLSSARMAYYHTNTRNWLALAVATGGSATNNTLLILDLDLLASNGSPSFFTFDMATNQPTWYKFSTGSAALEVMYETNGLVRLFTGDSLGNITDVDYQQGFGTEQAVTGAGLTTHAWGNDHPFLISRPTWMRFNTNRDPSILSSEQQVLIGAVSRAVGIVTVTTAAAHNLVVGQPVALVNVTDPTYNGPAIVATVPDTTHFTFLQAGATSSSSGGSVFSGWYFQCLGIDDDFYTFQSPLSLLLAPGLNDVATLCGNPNLASGQPFRYSPELFRIGGVNFVAGRRLRWTINFPSNPGVVYQFRSIQFAFGPNPPS
jgi:hypothetical protein